MTIKITPNFTLRRVAGQLTASIADGYHVVATVLTASQARDAAEAFNVMAVMLEAGGDTTDLEVAA